MAIVTEEKPRVHVKTAEMEQTKGFEMNRFQTWLTGLPWLGKEAVILAFIIVPLVAILILLKVMGL